MSSTDSRQALVGLLHVQAALAYDLAAVKFRGRGAATNYDISAFERELAQLDEVRLTLTSLPPVLLPLLQGAAFLSAATRRSCPPLGYIAMHSCLCWAAKSHARVGGSFKW